MFTSSSNIGKEQLVCKSTMRKVKIIMKQVVSNFCDYHGKLKKYKEGCVAQTIVEAEVGEI